MAEVAFITVFINIAGRDEYEFVFFGQRRSEQEHQQKQVWAAAGVSVRLGWCGRQGRGGLDQVTEHQWGIRGI